MRSFSTRALLETQSVLADNEELKDIVSGLDDIKVCKTKSIHELRQTVDKKEKA